jgi:uncharacterized membrane protein YvbJ
MNCGKSVNETQLNCDFCGAVQEALPNQSEKETNPIQLKSANESSDSLKINSNLVKCPHCSREIAKAATVCPSCGGESEYAAELKKSELQEDEKLKKARNKQLVPMVIIGLILVIAYFFTENYMQSKDKELTAHRKAQCKMVTNGPC